MENKQMTSVEWLYNEIKHIIPNDFIGKFEQAKEMEKNQIIDAYNEGSFDYNKTSEQYYNETYKK
jgi:hypothetical protein